MSILNPPNVVILSVGGVPSATGFFFNPNVIRGRTGDIISFQFTGVPGNHSVTQSSFDDPCNPLPGGFDSGNVFINSTEATTPIFNLTITDDTKPIWFFCKQLNPTPHCRQGMVGTINPPSSGNTFNEFISMARVVGTSRDAVGQGEGGLIGVGASASVSVSSHAGVTIFTGPPVPLPTSDGVSAGVTITLVSDVTVSTSITGSRTAITGVSHRLAHNAVIYISVSLSFTLILILLGVVIIMRRKARSNKKSAPNSSGLVLPFSNRPTTMRPTYNVPGEKQDSRHTRVTNGDGLSKGRRGIEDAVALVGSSSLHGTRPPPVTSHLPHMDRQAGQSGVVAEATVAFGHPRYRMHEDAGSVRSMTPVQEDEVIDVPPNYSSIIGRFRRGPEEVSAVVRQRVSNPAVREEGPGTELGKSES